MTQNYEIRTANGEHLAGLDPSRLEFEPVEIEVGGGKYVSGLPRVYYVKDNGDRLDVTPCPFSKPKEGT